MSVADKASTEPQAIHYAKLIVEKSNLRSVIRNCRIAVENAESEAVEYEDIRAELEGSILEIDSKGSKETTISDSIDEILEDIHKIQAGEFNSNVIKTNTGRLDGFLGAGGIAPGEVLTLAAPTSCGKSALALNIATKAMKQQSVPVAYFSFEMPQKQLVKRMSQSLSGLVSVPLRNAE